jgi:dTDP-4-amino-4,6-dideoxygalactose transaminase
MPRLVAWIDARAALWDRYDALLSGLPLELPPPAEPGTRHARHLYQVLLSPEAPITRDELLDRMTARNIGTGVHYRGVHLHSFYRDTYRIKPEHFPVTTSVSERTVSLPLSPKLNPSDQDDVVAALATALGGEQSATMNPR